MDAIKKIKLLDLTEIVAKTESLISSPGRVIGGGSVSFRMKEPASITANGVVGVTGCDSSGGDEEAEQR